MKRSSLLVVLAIVAAAVAGWWWRPAHKAAPTPAPASSSAPADRRGPASAGRPEGAAPGGEPGPALQVLVDDDPRGELRLEGIVDADEHPVGGATVALSSNPPRTVTTEADGTFGFDALVGRPYTLTARADAGVAGPVTARLTGKSEPVVLHLHKAPRVIVTVVGPDGKGLDGATVELRGVDVQQQISAGGAATFAQVVPGAYDVVGWAPGMARAFAEVAVGAGDAEARLALSPGAPVEGRVVDEGGAPVAGARVVFNGASDWRVQGDERRDAVTTGGDGAFRFDALGAGSFRFVATHAELASGTSALVTLDGVRPHAGVAITMPRGAAVRGKVVDGERRPVVGARVRIGVGGRAMLAAAPRQAYSDAEGAFEIKGLPRRELAAVALHESGASQTATLDTSRGDVAGVALVLDVTGTIAGVVVDAAGQPLEGIQVSAGPNFRGGRGGGDMANWRLRGFPEELTDSGGRFTLTGLAPGGYLVRASRIRAGGRRRFGGDGVEAETGTRDLKLTLQAEGAVKGKVAFADGTAPKLFTVSAGPIQQAFPGGDGAFTLDAVPPQTYELNVRGPTFQTKVVEVTVAPGKATDLGTITVAAGRRVAGVVVDPSGAPVAGATVFVGRQIFGSGSTNEAPFGPMGQGTKQDTTGPDGAFGLSGFGDGNLTVVAELASAGRSKALRLPADAPGQTELTLQLQPFGALRGALRQGDKPAEGVFVTCQSTTTPGATYTVASGPDGGYRFDRLAPDTYKVSATLGMPMMGMKFYSKQVDLPAGKEVVVDLAVEPGAVTLAVTAVPRAGQLGVASAWLASGVLAATTSRELQLRLAGAGPGASQWIIVRGGEPASFTELVPGAYTACVVPFPTEIRGMAAMGYADRHGDKLPAFCKQVTVAGAPASQALQVPVEIPPVIPEPDRPGGGGPRGGGPAGSGAPPPKG